MENNIISIFLNMIKELQGLSKYCQFCYIYHFKHGYYRELELIFNPKTLNEFESVGFIKTGYNKEGKTWGITKLGKTYFKEFVKDNKDSSFRVLS